MSDRGWMWSVRKTWAACHRWRKQEHRPPAEDQRVAEEEEDDAGHPEAPRSMRGACPASPRRHVGSAVPVQSVGGGSRQRFPRTRRLRSGYVCRTAQWYGRRQMAEIGLLLAVIAVPILIGAATAYLRRPWWWGAVVAICVFLVAALAPAPEEGESRVALGDVGFLVVVALVVASLVWLGSWLTGRIRSRSTSTG